MLVCVEFRLRLELGDFFLGFDTIYVNYLGQVLFQIWHKSNILDETMPMPTSLHSSHFSQELYYCILILPILSFHHP